MIWTIPYHHHHQKKLQQELHYNPEFRRVYRTSRFLLGLFQFKQRSGKFTTLLAGPNNTVHKIPRRWVWGWVAVTLSSPLRLVWLLPHWNETSGLLSSKLIAMSGIRSSFWVPSSWWFVVGSRGLREKRQLRVAAVMGTWRQGFTI